MPRSGTKANYLAKVKAAAAKTVKEGYVLAEDAARIINQARNTDPGF